MACRLLTFQTHHKEVATNDKLSRRDFFKLARAAGLGSALIPNEEGILIGPMGVSGSTVENDHLVAKAGVEAIGVHDIPEHPWRT